MKTRDLDLLLLEDKERGSRSLQSRFVDHQQQQSISAQTGGSRSPLYARFYSFSSSSSGLVSALDFETLTPLRPPGLSARLRFMSCPLSAGQQQQDFGLKGLTALTQLAPRRVCRAEIRSRPLTISPDLLIGSRVRTSFGPSTRANVSQNPLSGSAYVR